ncbi:hypothetical protein SAMN05519104_8259 [Rhizobiales bacterium GAS188]|nr:hypothetical protein SAMN05519104_8259 [Rhizobiales bacterium GAS188]
METNIWDRALTVSAVIVVIAAAACAVILIWSVVSH